MGILRSITYYNCPCLLLGVLETTAFCAFAPFLQRGRRMVVGVWSWDTAEVHRCHMSHCTWTNLLRLSLLWPGTWPRITASKAPFSICSGGFSFLIAALNNFSSLLPCPHHLLPRGYPTSGLGCNSRKLSN